MREDGSTPLHMACLTPGLAPLVAMLVSKGADPLRKDFARGWTPLHYSAHAGTSPAAEALLQAAAAPAQLLSAKAKRGVLPLQCAAAAGRCDVLRLLAGSQHRQGDTPTHTADSALRAVTEDGLTALVMACAHPRPEALRAVLDLGADPRDDTRRFCTPSSAGDG